MRITNATAVVLWLQVTPVDSRGESLLTMLQKSPKKRRTCGVSIRGESPISGWDDLDVQSVQSFCRRSSVDDAARKVSMMDLASFSFF